VDASTRYVHACKPKRAGGEAEVKPRLEMEGRERVARQGRHTTTTRLCGGAERARLPEPRHEPSAEVEAHEALESADGRAADEERRDGAVARRLSRGRKLLGAGVELDDGGVRAHGGQEALHDVRHVAPPAGEDDHGALEDQPAHALRRRLRLLRRVDGQPAPDAHRLHPKLK
jgi:hypothetical protein